MGKLIKLLNEFEQKVVKKSYIYPVYYYDDVNDKILNEHLGFNTEDEIKYEWLMSYIVSARYGFIKWLVDNDKIDRDRILKEDGVFRKKFYDLEFARIEDRLLMLLAISDTPIDDLISYLK